MSVKGCYNTMKNGGRYGLHNDERGNPKTSCMLEGNAQVTTAPHRSACIRASVQEKWRWRKGFA